MAQGIGGLGRRSGERKRLQEMSAKSAGISYEIRMVSATIGYADYARPAIVDSIGSDGTAVVYFLSTKNYSERGQSFCISSTHPDFAMTGLTATSYTIHPPQRIPISALETKRGSLAGELATEFKEWTG